MKDTLVDYCNANIYECDKADLEKAFEYFVNKQEDYQCIHLSYDDIKAYDGDLTALENIGTMLKYFYEARGEQLIEEHWEAGEMEAEMWEDVATAVEQYGGGD